MSDTLEVESKTDEKSSELVPYNEADFPIPQEKQEFWDRMLRGSKYAPKTIRILRRIASGMPVMQACRTEGVDHKDVYTYARQWGLIDTRTAKLMDLHRNVSKQSLEALERRINEDPESVSARDLAVIAGISTDKVMQHEAKANDSGANYISALERAAAKIAESGAELELKVTIRKPSQDSDPEAAQHVTLIDVTPNP